MPPVRSTSRKAVHPGEMRASILPPLPDASLMRSITSPIGARRRQVDVERGTVTRRDPQIRRAGDHGQVLVLAQDD